MKNLSVILNFVLSIFSTQLFASNHAPAEFQNDILKPLVVNTADIGVPTLPPITYQEKSFALTFAANYPAVKQIPVDIRAARFGNTVFLSIKAVRFHTDVNFVSLSATLPDNTFYPPSLTQLPFAPIIGEDVVTKYKSDSIGLVIISPTGNITIWYTAPPTEDYWPQNENCGWNELTLTYGVAP